MRWQLVFAAADVSLFKEVAAHLVATVKMEKDRSPRTVSGIAEKVYSTTLRTEFAARHLSQLGYKDVDDFRRTGLQELGKDTYDDLVKQLYKFDLGVELIIFGYNEFKNPSLFVVENPGRAVDLGWQGYAAVGSGFSLAMASLRHKPMPDNLEHVIYRVLEAKFTSETASNVGKATLLRIINKDGVVRELQEDEIQKIRTAWEGVRSEPPPSEALDVLTDSRAVRDLD
jgi:hypothetical protein